MEAIRNMMQCPCTFYCPLVYQCLNLHTRFPVTSCQYHSLSHPLPGNGAMAMTSNKM